LPLLLSLLPLLAAGRRAETRAAEATASCFWAAMPLPLRSLQVLLLRRLLRLLLALSQLRLSPLLLLLLHLQYLQLRVLSPSARC
jgi:hypothetical protein